MGGVAHLGVNDIIVVLFAHEFESVRFEEGKVPAYDWGEQLKTLEHGD